jgi:hypothetical protein
MPERRPEALLQTVQGLDQRPFAGVPGFCLLAPN